MLILKRLCVLKCLSMRTLNPTGWGWGMLRAPTARLKHLCKGFQIILIKSQFCLTWRQNNKTFSSSPTLAKNKLARLSPYKVFSGWSNICE